MLLPSQVMTYLQANNQAQRIPRTPQKWKFWEIAILTSAGQGSLDQSSLFSSEIFQESAELLSSGSFFFLN